MRTSWVACKLNDSSTLVYGARKTWTEAVARIKPSSREPIAPACRCFCSKLLSELMSESYVRDMKERKVRGNQRVERGRVVITRDRDSVRVLDELGRYRGKWLGTACAEEHHCPLHLYRPPPLSSSTRTQGHRLRLWSPRSYGHCWSRRCR